ncbi:BadF/BadG/BcrA/BcrD ATPase family protein [Mycobacterium sp. ML4]
MTQRPSAAVTLAVDLGKTRCRAAARGRTAAGPGAPGLTAPGGVPAAASAILAVARDFGPVEEVVVGAAGALAAPQAARALGDALLAALPAHRVTVTSDAVIAHAGALNGEPGIVLIAGTGVVALTIEADGSLRTADGWGPWLGDEGGGAWIGAAGLRAAVRAVDGRGPATTLLVLPARDSGHHEPGPRSSTTPPQLRLSRPRYSRRGRTPPHGRLSAQRPSRSPRPRVQQGWVRWPWSEDWPQ